jgi:hypothetical protein
VPGYFFCVRKALYRSCHRCVRYYAATLSSPLSYTIARAGSQRVNRAVDGDVVAIELVAGPPSAAEQALDAVLTAQQLALQVRYRFDTVRARAVYPWL